MTVPPLSAMAIAWSTEDWTATQSKTTSALPPSASRTCPVTSGARASTVTSAPRASARWRLARFGSVLTIFPAPCARSTARVNRPMVPAPRMATDRPATSPASRTACTGVDSGSMSAAVLSSSASGTECRRFAGRVK